VGAYSQSIFLKSNFNTLHFVTYGEVRMRDVSLLSFFFR
jgi:hypothetical protein